MFAAKITFAEDELVQRTYERLAVETDAYRSAATWMDLDIESMVLSISKHFIGVANSGVARAKRVNNAKWGSAAFLISTGGYLREYDR